MIPKCKDGCKPWALTVVAPKQSKTMKVPVTEVCKVARISTLIRAIFISLPVREDHISCAGWASLCALVYPLWPSEGFYLHPFLPQPFFPSYGNIPFILQACARIPNFSKIPSMMSTPDPMLPVPCVLLVSGLIHGTASWKCCVCWPSPLPYLSLTPLWLPSRKLSNSFSQGCQWILLVCSCSSYLIS